MESGGGVGECGGSFHGDEEGECDDSFYGNGGGGGGGTMVLTVFCVVLMGMFLFFLFSFYEDGGGWGVGVGGRLMNGLVFNAHSTASVQRYYSSASGCSYQEDKRGKSLS